ncbi:unnamed protein product, partial [Prorocentrum cordatum]
GSPASRRTGSWWSRSPRSGVSGRTSRWPAWRCPTPPPARRTASTCGRASSPGADVSPVAVAATAVVVVVFVVVVVVLLVVVLPRSCVEFG